MIETLKYANISSIYTKDLIFYDAENEEECIQFCKRNGISYLPDTSRKSCWKFETDTFHEVGLNKVHIIAPTELIFSESTLRKFTAAGIDEVLMVVEKEQIKAVVHVVDYNNLFIQVECFKAISSFERSVRNLLKYNGETNHTFLQWCQGQNQEHFHAVVRQFAPDDEKQKRRMERRMSDLSEFQMFNLSDLLTFGVAKGILPEEWGSVLKEGDKLYSITQLRNFIAHNKDFTNVEIREGSSPLFSIRGLERFTKHFEDFVHCFEYVQDITLQKPTISVLELPIS